jgi:hydrogenase/urease accessory protein HupE
VIGLHPRPLARWRTGIVLAIAVLGVVADPNNTAHAHLVTSGAGPFFDGVAHFFVSLDDLLVVVAASLFAGFLGKASARWVLLSLPLAWWVGMLLGVNFAMPWNSSDWATGITLLIAGLVLAANPTLPVWGVAVMVVVLGLLHGSWNGAAMRATQTSTIASFGIVTAASVVTLLFSATAVSVQTPWHKIALRVIGSWIAAFGMLAIAWHFRPAA